MKKIILSLYLFLALSPLLWAQTKASNAFTTQDWNMVKSTHAPGFKELLLQQFAYFTSYNPANRIPNYVSWCLTRAHADGNYSRKGYSFYPNDNIPGIKAEPKDYTRSGYDRGHMCPAGDNKWSQQALSESFLMTNICPQTHTLNAGDWKKLEEKCRQWAQKYGKIYIVCGPIITKKSTQRIGIHKVLVPQGFFKVVLCTEGEPKAIGFIYPNNDTKKPLKSYAVSVDEVEKQTGIDFFSALDDKIEKRIEHSFQFSQW